MIPYGSGLRKSFKKDPVKKAILRTPPELTGAIFTYGRIKSGKTTSMLSLAQLYHDNPNRRYKIFDLWGGSRNEQLYWGLPSNQKNYWDYVQKKLRLDREGPKQYNVTYYYPLTKKLRKELPFKPGSVNSKVFTIDIKDITPQDLALTIGTMPDKTVAHFKESVEEMKRTTTIEEFEENFKKKVRKDDTLYNSVIKPLIKQGLLQKTNSPLNLTTKQISKELDDKENIAVLCLDFVDKEYQLFVIGYLLRKICDELDRKRRRTIGIIREASEFFRVTDQSIAPERMKVFKTYISDWIKMGRRGLHLLIDTQSPSEVRGLVDGQQDLTLLGRLPSEADRKMGTDQLYRDGLITKKQINQLGIMNPGQFMICPSGKPSYFTYILLPRSRYWQEKNGNFYNNIWEKDVGHWMNFEEELEKLKEEKEKEKLEKKKLKEEKLKEETEVKSVGVMPEEIEEQFKPPQSQPEVNLNQSSTDDFSLLVDTQSKEEEKPIQKPIQKPIEEVKKVEETPKEIPKEVKEVEKKPQELEKKAEEKVGVKDNNVKKRRKRLTADEMMELAILGKLD